MQLVVNNCYFTADRILQMETVTEMWKLLTPVKLRWCHTSLVVSLHLLPLGGRNCFQLHIFISEVVQR